MVADYIRDVIVRLLRNDVINFIDAHEEDLIRIFREEMQAVDDRVEDEKTFVDLRLAVMGEELLRGVLQALRRFMREV
jgi:Flp pilus assembly CpaF family ATPase